MDVIFCFLSFLILLGDQLAHMVQLESGPEKGGGVLLIKSPRMASPEKPAWIELPKHQTKTEIRIDFGEIEPSIRFDCFVFWIADPLDETGNRKGPLNVMKSIPSTAYNLQSIPAGQHAIIAQLLEGSPTPSTHADRRNLRVLESQEVLVEVREAEEFQPSYIYKAVEEYHRLPAGLEVSIDLTKGTRVARISHEWQFRIRVQTSLAEGESLEFCRFMITRSTQVKEIVQLINAKFPSEMSYQLVDTSTGHAVEQGLDAEEAVLWDKMDRLRAVLSASLPEL